MRPGVDLVITTYNRRDMACRAVENALRQDCAGLEVTVVDDGGTDGTSEALRSRFGDRIRLIRQENRGLSAARNCGIAGTEGELVAFLDDDDLLLPGKLRRQAEILRRRPEAGFCCGAGYMVKSWRARPERLAAGPEGRVLGELLRQNFGPPHSYMVRRDLLDRVGGFDEALTSVEDWDLWLRCAAVSECAFDPEAGYIYYLAAENMSRDHENMLLHMLLVFDRHAARWDGPEVLKREFRARHVVKFARRFLDHGPRRRGIEVAREAFLTTSLTARLMPVRYLGEYLRADAAWLQSHAPSILAEDRRGRTWAAGNFLRAAVRQAAGGDVSGCRSLVLSLAEGLGSRILSGTPMRGASSR